MKKSVAPAHSKMLAKRVARTLALLVLAAAPAQAGSSKATLDQIRDLTVDYTAQFELFQQTGDGDVQDEAFMDSVDIAQLTLGLAKTDPDQYEAVLKRFNRLGKSRAEAVFDLGLSLQAEWESKYLYKVIHQVIEKQRRRGVPAEFFTQWGSFRQGYQALVDPFETVGYFETFSKISTWWSVGALVGEKVADVGQPQFPPAPASRLDLAVPFEGDAIREEGRVRAARNAVSVGVGGWAGAAVTRLGAQRLAGIQGPLAVKVVAWVGLIAIGLYADEQATETTSAILSQANEKRLVKRLKSLLQELAQSLRAKESRAGRMVLARKITETGYRLAAHWEGVRENKGYSEAMDADVKRYLAVAGMDLCGEEASRQVCQDLASEVARGKLKHTVEGLFLQLAAYFNQTNDAFLQRYADQVFYARALRNVFAKTAVLVAKGEGDREGLEDLAEQMNHLESGGKP